jgi:hypothetical protein
MRASKASSSAGLPAALGAVALAAAAALAPAGAATNPLGKLLSETGNAQLCFRRAYDTAALKRGRATGSVLLSIAGGEDKTGMTVWLKLQLRLRGRAAPANVGASCEWSARANFDTSGNRLLEAYPRDDGFACLALYSNQIAEEAGTLMFDLAPDGRTLTLYLDSSVGLWGSTPPVAPIDEKTGKSKLVSGSQPLALGRKDRVFRLTRAEPAACGEMERTIAIEY